MAARALSEVRMPAHGQDAGSGAPAPRPGSKARVGTSLPLLVALYLRDASNLHDAGTPRLPPLEPRIRGSQHHHLIAQAGGPAVLRVEWEAWWEALLRTRPQIWEDPRPKQNGAPARQPLPERAAPFAGSPALALVAQAHRGASLSWAQAAAQAHQRQLTPLKEAVADMPEPATSVDILLVPVGAARAWLIEPGTILVAERLLGDRALLHSYLEPMFACLGKT